MQMKAQPAHGWSFEYREFVTLKAATSGRLTTMAKQAELLALHMKGTPSR